MVIMIFGFDLEHIYHEDLDMTSHLKKDTMFAQNQINRSDYIRDSSYNDWHFMLFDFTSDFS
jgi:hypothetical protein